MEFKHIHLISKCEFYIVKGLDEWCKDLVYIFYFIHALKIYF